MSFIDRESERERERKRVTHRGMEGGKKRDRERCKHVAVMMGVGRDAMALVCLHA